MHGGDCPNCLDAFIIGEGSNRHDYAMVQLTAKRNGNYVAGGAHVVTYRAGDHVCVVHNGGSAKKDFPYHH